MPVLPTAIDINRANAQPTTAVAQYQPGAVEEATSKLGHTVTRAADTVVDVQHRLARLHAQDALVQLKRSQNELTFGDDGYARLQNGDAAAPGVYKKYEDLHKAAIETNAAKLSPLARQYYERDAKEMGDNFQAGFLRHAMTEEINHRGAVFQAGVQVSAQTAALNYNNPEALANEQTVRNRMLAEYFANNGITDSKEREFLSQKAHGEAHEAVIRQLLTNNQVQDAAAYLKQNKTEITQERFQALDNAMKNELSADEGRRIGTELYNMRVQGKSEVEIQQEKNRLTQGKSANTSNFVDNVYGDLVRAQEQDGRRAMGSILLDQMRGTGGGLNDPRLKELEINNPALAAQVRRSLQGQADKASGKTPAALSDMQVYGQVMEKIRNGEDIDENDITGYAAGKLKPADTKALISALNRRDSAAGKFKINKALIDAGAPKSASNKDRRDAYRGAVESKLQEWKDENPGKLPTPEEQKRIIGSATDEYVAVDNFMYFDTTKPAYQLEEGATNVYPKRYKTMQPGLTDDQLVSAFSAYKAFKADKNNRGVSEAQFLDAWAAELNEQKAKGR